MKTNFDFEKKDLIEKITKLECNKKHQTQKKDIFNECDSKVNKIKSEQMNIKDNKIKLFAKSINPVELNRGPKTIKIKNNERPKSRSKSKESFISTSSYNKRFPDDNVIKITSNK